MNYHTRNTVIAKHEDDALNAYLNREEPQHCKRCACYSPDEEYCPSCRKEIEALKDHGEEQ
jgi:hypothetical protein